MSHHHGQQSNVLLTCLSLAPILPSKRSPWVTSLSCKARSPFCRTSSFSAAFAMGLLLAFLYRRCSRCAVFYKNHKALRYLHGLIEALYVRMKLVESSRGFAGSELENGRDGALQSHPYGETEAEKEPGVPALLPSIAAGC